MQAVTGALEARSGAEAAAVTSETDALVSQASQQGRLDAPLLARLVYNLTPDQRHDVTAELRSRLSPLQEGQFDNESRRIAQASGENEASAAVSGSPTSRSQLPSDEPRLGNLSMLYETGFRPGQEALAAARVSTGEGDPGGVSYGAYQLASSHLGGRQVQAFLHAEGRPWAGSLAGMQPEVPGGALTTAWRQVAAQQPSAFFEAQHAYTERTHYAPAIAFVAQQTGLDVSARSHAVQNVAWSMAVQHGRAPQLITDAVRQVGPQGTRSDRDYDRALVNQLYDTRQAYVTGRPVTGTHPVHMSAHNMQSLTHRYASERQDALAALDQ